MAARILIAGKQPTVAREALQPLLLATKASGRQRNALEVQLLMAITYAETGEMEKATVLVKEAGTLARPQNYIRLFLDQGTKLEKLLAHASKSLSHEKALGLYFKTLLQTFNQTLPQPHLAHNLQVLAEPLTRQEEKVLRLLNAGQTNPQIARELIVSVNTVRTQVQSIYRKLNVNNRQSAREIAHQLHLI